MFHYTPLSVPIPFYFMRRWWKMKTSGVMLAPCRNVQLIRCRHDPSLASHPWQLPVIRGQRFHHEESERKQMEFVLLLYPATLVCSNYNYKPNVKQIYYRRKLKIRPSFSLSQLSWFDLMFLKVQFVGFYVGIKFWFVYNHLKPKKCRVCITLERAPHNLHSEKVLFHSPPCRTTMLLVGISKRINVFHNECAVCFLDSQGHIKKKQKQKNPYIDIILQWNINYM